MSIRTAIIGPTGYTGVYLIQLLLRHAQAQITYLASRRDERTDITHEFPQLLGRLPEEVAICKPIDPEAIAREADVAFVCLPHKAAMQQVPSLLDAGVRVIDLSADYRLKNEQVYSRYYNHAHADLANLAEAVYGLPEFFRDQLPGAMLVANPGCYPTGAALAVGPLLQRSLVKPTNVIINAASGATGAGRSLAPHLHFAEHNEAFAAYGTVGGHRHQPEIEQTLATVFGQPVPVLFVPHLLPVDRGILETIYLEPAEPDVTEQDLFDALNDAYEDEPFVRVRPDLPNIKHVRDTNFCDVSVRLVTDDGRPPRVIAFSALDNMIKGASGQAIQNMNLVFELEETLGLI